MRSQSYIATPPGATIKEQLNDRCMSQKEFAARMNMSEKHISKLINGSVHLTPEMAVKLELVLGVPAKFWNNLEAIYREKLIKVDAENAMDVDETLARQLPYNEMAEHGWVSVTANPKEQVVRLRKYFEVVELALLQKNQFTHIACRKLSVAEKRDFASLAWVQEAKIESRKVPTGPTNLRRLMEALPEIRKMTRQKPQEFCPHLKPLMAECGIALVFVPCLKESFLEGASFMDGHRTVVSLTANGKDADEFWFGLFHELGHVVLGHIAQTDGTTVQDERAADEWSRDKLIPTEDFEGFKEEKLFTAHDVSEFADKIGVAPGIVVGRLQYEGCIERNRLNELKEHYVIA